MSRKYKEVRLWDDGRLTVAKEPGYAIHYFKEMYSLKGYSFTSCLDKKSHIKRAKKFLCKKILKTAEKDKKVAERKIKKIEEALQKLG